MRTSEGQRQGSYGSFSHRTRPCNFACHCIAIPEQCTRHYRSETLSQLHSHPQQAVLEKRHPHVLQLCCCTVTPSRYNAIFSQNQHCQVAAAMKNSVASQPIKQLLVFQYSHHATDMHPKTKCRKNVQGQSRVFGSGQSAETMQRMLFHVEETGASQTRATVIERVSSDIHTQPCPIRGIFKGVYASKGVPLIFQSHCQ